MQARLRLLAVDDDLDILRNLALALSLEGYFVVTASSGIEASSLLQEHHFDVVITDLRMPVVDGFEIVKRTQSIQPEARIIVTSRYLDEHAMAFIEEAGAVGLEKPYNMHLLSELLQLQPYAWHAERMNA